MSHWPRTGCSVIALKGEKVLLIKRGKEPYLGHWSLPGGAQELGETLEECALRELQEETGLIAAGMNFAAVRDRITRDEQGAITHHYVLSSFVAPEFEGHAEAADDALDLGWFTLEEMKELKTTPDTPAFIAEVLSESRADKSDHRDY